MERERSHFDWLQFASILLTLIGFALYNEGRLARIEQRQIDAEEQHRQLVQQLQKLEDKWDRSPTPCRPSQTAR
jgi:hypothetical protein